MRIALGITLALVLTVFVSGMPSTATAAPLTLDDAITLALRNRVVIIQTQGAEELARAGRRAALGSFLPRLRTSYTYGKSKQTNQKVDIKDTLGNVTKDVSIDDAEGTNKIFSVDASISIFDLANFYNYSASSADVARANLDVIASEQDLIFSVKLSFYAFLAAVENVAVQEDAVKRAEEQLKLIQSRFDLGSASLSDVLKQKVLYGTDRLELLRARNAVTTTESDLAFTIGVDPRQDWEFSTQYTVREYDGTLNDAIEFGLTHRPALLADELNLKSASKSVSASRAEYLPKLDGFASYSKFSGSSGFATLTDRSSDTREYGFTASWNIFDGFFRERNITASRVTKNNAEAFLADTRNSTVTDIKTAYLNIELLREQKSVSEENVEAATEDLKITQEKYNLGAATILDLLSTQVSLKRAQVSLIQIDFDLNLAISTLENAMGKM
ncbi:MAG: TolC family protein [candidate division Zixibacteria bacterium]|nr:TolC family protein [candidate division Zixibacteria bacterium]